MRGVRYVLCLFWYEGYGCAGLGGVRLGRKGV